MECALVRGNTNTHSTSLAGSAVLGRCQRDVHLFLMFPPTEQKPSLFGGPVAACLGTAGWRGALIHIDNHTVMVIVINHLCHGTPARRSRMD